MSKPHLVLQHKAGVPSVVGARSEFRDADQSPLYDVMDRARRDYLRAVHAWQVQCRPSHEQVSDEAGTVASTFYQITSIVRGAPLHGR